MTLVSLILCRYLKICIVILTGTVDDFRGISISQVISKVLERCVLSRYESFFVSSDNQFGFKRWAAWLKLFACNLYCKICGSGSTVNLCALDVKKAFDKLNHFGLFLKLMDRLIPSGLLSVLEHWLNISATCVRWCDHFSDFFTVACGVRQGGVLSPYLFAIYVDDIVAKINTSDLGCMIG